MKKPKIALVLSGGASLGFAHIGVIEELLKENIVPDIVVGTSMGAVVGGAYACGITIDKMKELTNKMSFFKFVDINFKPAGAFSGRKITKLLESAYGQIEVKDCICEFSTIAVDIKNGKQEVLKDGKVLDIVRASMNIPGLLIPYEINGVGYVDGGIINNYPDDVAKELGADIIIGVDVLKNSYRNDNPKNAMATLSKSLQILQNTLYNFKHSYSDLVMSPDLKIINMMDFKNSTIEYAIEVGRLCCLENIKEIKKIIRNWGKKTKDNG